jgi:hypothetical protein
MTFERSAQRITADERKWRMREPDHPLSWTIDDMGSAEVTIEKYRDGGLGICASETGKRTREVYIRLNPDAARSLREFLNVGAEEQGAK